MEKDDNDSVANYRFMAYWQMLGRVVSLFCIPLLLFSILLPLRIDNTISWNYWYVFSPLLATLVGFLLATTSQSLSAPAPPVVRLVWILWVIAVSVFVVFLVMRLQGYSFFHPSMSSIFMPLYCGLGVMLFSSFYLFLTGCCSSVHYVQKKYVVAGTPLFCFSVVTIPLVILISFREGVDHIAHTSWALMFIPLFVCDAFCFCMGFFLLIFSFGNRNDAIFSVLQLILFLVIIPASVCFKVLLCLYLDNVLRIPMIYVFAPLIALEVLLFTCGIAVTSHKKKLAYIPVNST